MAARVERLARASMACSDGGDGAAGGRCRTLLDKEVQRRQHHQRQQRRGYQSADEDHGQRLLHFRTDAVRQRHRQQPEHRQKRRHQHRAKTDRGTRHDRLARRQPLPA